MDAENEADPTIDSNPDRMEIEDPESETDSFDEVEDRSEEMAAAADNSSLGVEGGPVTAELVATRSELKRVQEENRELKDRLARRQADFENYRKRVDRERTETYNRVVADVASKVLGVLDNLKRALETESSVEASESDEFRHFLSGVDLIYKQLSGVLEALGVKPIISVGEQFNPHIHEAVVTEVTDEVEPDTVVQEIRTGYRLGDRLIRPALVKVATRG
ncbi:MAG TPA: nucleotide exchange factor GrpE [Pyrinomonadaceae bacterium]|jgi:Molecular chaperone GrpE (heat shock protein)|nr:nucleotide exchange factor GrpE [Pyrinomonadaceae bacterium]